MGRSIMKAVIIRKFGEPEVLEFVNNYPEPDIFNNQVLVKVNAASVNPLDYRIRKGDLRLITGSNFPIILGNDICGTIVKCGSEVRNLKVGDQVYGMVDSNKKFAFSGFAKSGSYAEYCVTREDTLSLKPSSLSWEEAASIPLCCLTAYQALVDKAQIKTGDKVLINGASGGVGIFAIQIAKAFGANVTAVCSEKNSDFVKGFGVETVIDYKGNDISKLNDKFEVVYDVAASRSYFQIKNVLKKNGVFISNIANPINILWTILLPLLRIFGLRKRNTFAWVKPSGKKLSIITKMFEDEKIKPFVDKVYSLDKVADAHRYLESGRVRGKIVIKVQ